MTSCFMDHYEGSVYKNITLWVKMTSFISTDKIIAPLALMQHVICEVTSN